MQNTWSVPCSSSAVLVFSWLGLSCAAVAYFGMGLRSERIHYRSFSVVVLVAVAIMAMANHFHNFHPPVKHDSPHHDTHTVCLSGSFLFFATCRVSNINAETLIWWIFVSWNHIFKQDFIVIMTFFILGDINTNPEMIHIFVSGNIPMTFNPHCLYHGLLEITATFSWIKMQSSKW